MLKPGQRLVQKGRYVATVDVPFFLDALLTPSLLKSELEKKGFSSVSVSESKPAGFPLPGSGDYYVTVIWTKTPKVFDVPDAVTAHRKVA